MPTKRRKLVRELGVTPSARLAYRTYIELKPAVAACDEARSRAEQRRDYTEYHRLMPPCGESCVCKRSHDAHEALSLEFLRRLDVLIWETNPFDPERSAPEYVERAYRIKQDLEQ